MRTDIEHAVTVCGPKFDVQGETRRIPRTLLIQIFTRRQGGRETLIRQSQPPRTLLPRSRKDARARTQLSWGNVTPLKARNVSRSVAPSFSRRRTPRERVRLIEDSERHRRRKASSLNRSRRVSDIVTWILSDSSKVTDMSVTNRCVWGTSASSSFIRGMHLPARPPPLDTDSQT